jgi:hypothetical protein
MSILLSHMPSPIPRRDQSSFVLARSTSGGLPRRKGGSAPALRVSRSAQRLLTLWPACLLTPLRSLFLQCFSPIRYLLEPLQVLPVGATSYRAGFAPARINTPLHGTRTEARWLAPARWPEQRPSRKRSSSTSARSILIHGFRTRSKLRCLRPRDLRARTAAAVKEMPWWDLALVPHSASASQTGRAYVSCLPLRRWADN